jgi:hypothetical protein
VRANAQTSISTTTDLYPGVYIGGISISGGTVTLHANADGTPGIYYLQGGGFTVSGQAVVKTAAGETGGVMLYNAWSGSSDAINVSGQASITLVPPSSGTYRGISVFQKRGTATALGPTITISGGGTLNIGGTFYAAYSPIALAGNGGSNNVAGGQYIADTLSILGNGSVNVSANGQAVSQMRQYGLVE